MGKEAKYIVRLTDEERHTLQQLVVGPRVARDKALRARMLLKAEVDGPHWGDGQIAAAFDVGVATIHRLRQRLVEEGLEAALTRQTTRPHEATQTRRRAGSPSGGHRVQPGASGTRVLDAAPAGGEAGRTRDCGGHRAGNRAANAQKNDLKPWLKEQWVIPPEANAAFVCAMEDTLEVYQRPYDEHRPLVCFDEGTKQLVKDVRPPIPGAPGHRERIDYEYERNGTGNLFMMFEPLAGQREVLVTARRTAVDYAEAIQHLVDVRYPSAEKIVLVQDNLNTHTLASLYEAFPPEEARRLIAKLEVHYTPKHGSWLNMAEIELGVLRRQCLDRRVPDFSTLIDEVAVWQSDRNAIQVKVSWQFTTADARVKLKRLYPILEPIKNKWTDH